MTAVRRGLLLVLALLAAAASAAAGASGTAPEGILKEYVLGQRPWSDVELRNLSLDAQPPAGPPRRISVRKGLPGRTVFTMEYPNGAVVTATADVEAFEEIVVASRRLSKDRPLGEDDVFLARTEVGRVPTGALRDTEAAVGKVLNRAVGANVPLLSRHLSGSKVVKRGRKVTLVAESGGVRIAAAGMTREDARVDDSVKTINLASKKTVTGILIDENTVRVDY